MNQESNTFYTYSSSAYGSDFYSRYANTTGSWNPKPAPIHPLCATCGLPVPKRDMIEHLDIHAQGL